MQKYLKAFLTIIITTTLLVTILLNTDISVLKDNITSINYNIFALSLIIFLIALLLSAYRWQIMSTSYNQISFIESLKILFTSLTLNIFLPSRLGDIGKAFFSNPKKSNISTGVAAAMIEKLYDLLSILVFSSIGAIFIITEIKIRLLILCSLTIVILVTYISIFNTSTQSYIFKKFRRMINSKKFHKHLKYIAKYLKDNYVRNYYYLVCSLVIWGLHFIHIFLLFEAINIHIDFIIVIGLIPVAIIIGMIPITISGFGTREAMIFFLFIGYANYEQLTVFVLLFSVRYFVPAIIGSIFLRHYLSSFLKNIYSTKSK